MSRFVDEFDSRRGGCVAGGGGGGGGVVMSDSDEIGGSPQVEVEDVDGDAGDFDESGDLNGVAFLVDDVHVRATEGVHEGRRVVCGAPLVEEGGEFVAMSAESSASEEAEEGGQVEGVFEGNGVQREGGLERGGLEQEIGKNLKKIIDDVNRIEASDESKIEIGNFL